MKPHEEAWEAERDGDEIKVWVHAEERFRDCFVGAPDMDRAQLAAQAPAMARRILSRLEDCTAPSERGADGLCGCTECRDDRAVLRDAGVLE